MSTVNNTASTPTAAPTVTSTDKTALGRVNLASNFQTFLTLLTTQLKNQDPLSPLDSNQFTQQLVQMSGVEQQLNTNDLLQKLVSNTGSGVTSAVGLIGKQVRAASADAQLKGGQASWIYNLDRNASDVKLEVLDSRGAVVKAVAPTANGAGDHSFTWDGKGASGSSLSDGAYTLRVTAKDSSGSVVTSTVSVEGVVTGVEQSNGQSLLTLGSGTQVTLDKVTSINQPAAAAAVAPTLTDGKTSSPPTA